MLDLRIDGARVLCDGGEPVTVSVGAQDGCVRFDAEGSDASRVIRADGLLLAPGIVDVHGDAFERQIMPRPGVNFDIRLALADTDRQLVANGITTAFHGVTYSWEPGLRGRDNCLALLEALHGMKQLLAADNRFHLRFETFNLDGVEDVVAWIDDDRFGLLAFNDHAREIASYTGNDKKVSKYLERTGLDRREFESLVDRIVARADEVPAATASLAGRARERGMAMLSHDDPDPQTREMYRSLGCCVAEFPETEATARAARDAGDAVVMGAPNVVRGGSHNGSISAATMIRHDLCDVLASDYYYPAPLQAAFRLARESEMPLGMAWSLVAGNAARAVGLDDRGTIAEGQRADLILIDDADDSLPRPIATFVAGRTVFLGDDGLLAA